MDWKWVVLAGALWSRIITTATVVCMGAFYDSVHASFGHVTEFSLSMAFAVATGFLEGMGFVVRLLITKYEARYLILAGALFATLGVVAASLTSSYILLLICYGFMNGIGQSMARFIMPTAVGYVFDDSSRHVGLAVMNSGDGIGGVLAPLLLTWLIKEMTWRPAMLVVAALVLNLLICAVTVPMRLFLKKKPDENGDKASKKLVKKADGKKVQPVDEQESNNASSSDDHEVTFINQNGGVSLFPNVILFYLNIATHSIGYFIFMTFLLSDLAAHDVDTDTAGLVAALIGGVSIIGRLGVSLVPNWRYMPRWALYALCHVIRGLSVLATLMSPKDPRGCALWYAGVCAIYGLSDGITGALIPIIAVDLFGLSNFASVLGGEMMIMGAGAVVGVPMAGFLKDCFKGYTMPFVLSGCSFVFAGLILLPLFCTKKHYQYLDVGKQIELVDVKQRSVN